MTEFFFGIVLNLWWIIILNRPIHECSMYFHLFKSSFIFFIRIFQLYHTNPIHFFQIQIYVFHFYSYFKWYSKNLFPVVHCQLIYRTSIFLFICFVCQIYFVLSGVFTDLVSCNLAKLSCQFLQSFSYRLLEIFHIDNYMETMMSGNKDIFIYSFSMCVFYSFWCLTALIRSLVQC